MKVYVKLGTMDSSKTARLLMDAYEYKQRGEFAFLLKPKLDTRSKAGKIVSRIGLEADCLDIERDDNIYEGVLGMDVKPACIFVDEAQFLTNVQVIHLRLIADILKIPVMCYGLKSDFLGNLFEGSKALIEHANSVEEVKTICRHENCKNKAMYNGRFKDGLPVFDGETVLVGDTAENANGKDVFYYIPKCSFHYFQDFSNYNKNKGV